MKIHSEQKHAPSADGPAGQWNPQVDTATWGRKPEDELRKIEGRAPKLADMVHERQSAARRENDQWIRGFFDPDRL